MIFCAFFRVSRLTLGEYSFGKSLSILVALTLLTLLRTAKAVVGVNRWSTGSLEKVDSMVYPKRPHCFFRRSFGCFFSENNRKTRFFIFLFIEACDCLLWFEALVS